MVSIINITPRLWIKKQYVLTLGFMVLIIQQISSKTVIKSNLWSCKNDFFKKIFFVPKDDRRLETGVNYKSRTEKNPQIRFAYIINSY
jgi:hypothetical protein